MTYCTSNHLRLHMAARVTRWAAITSGVLILCSCRGVPLQESPKSVLEWTSEAEKNVRATPTATENEFRFRDPPEAFQPQANPQPETNAQTQTAAPPAAKNTAAEPGDSRSSPDQQRETSAIEVHSPALLHHRRHVGLRYGPTKPRWVAPDLIAPPPPGEYICDGGDRERPVLVETDWTVRGLDQEDTVVHYDTVNGETHVEASNRECIYAPRFAAVRKIYGIVQSERHQKAAGYDTPTRLQIHGEVQNLNSVDKRLQASRHLGTDTPITFRERTQTRRVDDARQLVLTQHAFQPFEDFNVLRTGRHLNSEKARLSAKTLDARQWMTTQMVQVTVKDLTAVEAAGDVSMESVYTYELPKGKARVRVIKVASKHDAKPNDEVEFSIRFDNVGDQPVGNVTVIDSLTTRLEYVEGSQSCSLKAEFKTAENDGQSLVLRWEITDPVEVGKGGLIRFKCRVR